jgi:signal transduction histidine kinase
MQERAHLLGGTLDIDSGPGRGTTVILTIPEPQRNAAAGSDG